MTIRSYYQIILMFSLGFITAGCLNPFAPVEGDVGETVWSDQTTVRGLLDNFALSYDYRDSLRYSDCLDESFVFRYYDAENGYYDSWFRETDLKTTGGMFRAFDRINLEWNMIPDTVDNYDQAEQKPGSLEFIVRFNLSLGNEAPLMGYAVFTTSMGVDSRFRIIEWRDDF
ncbi:MAG: hypothetical protein HQ568_00410 [Calditrichaeota bacterium]|nr:hypothetical protein [Calditrichota bacterium]